MGTMVAIVMVMVIVRIMVGRARMQSDYGELCA